MNPREVKSWGVSEWEEARERGKAHFILHYGIVGFALPVGLVMFVFFYAIEPMLLGGATLADVLSVRPGELVELLLVSAVVWSLAGWGWAEWAWRLADREHPSHRSDGPERA